MSRIITLDATELVLRVARATVGAAESPPNSNAGPFVQACQRVTGNKPPDPWCASYVNRMGRTALHKQWPVFNSASCQQIAAWAVRTGCLLDAGTPAEPGDLFVVYYAKLKRFAHIGFVDTVQGQTVQTIEGNTSQPGDNDPKTAREGWLVASKPRVLAPRDRLIRWVNLL
jgi:hypothetical protein